MSNNNFFGMPTGHYSFIPEYIIEDGNYSSVILLYEKVSLSIQLSLKQQLTKIHHFNSLRQLYQYIFKYSNHQAARLN